MIFKISYSNHAIVGAKAASVVYRCPAYTNGVGQYAMKFRHFLTEYQSAYRARQTLPTPPAQLNVYWKSLRAKFRLEADNIENMIKAAYRIKVPRPKNNKPKFNKRNNSRQNRRK